MSTTSRTRTKPNKNSAASVHDHTLKNVETIAKMERIADEERTTGERVADWIARLVGSWPFIIVQSVLLAVWIVLNAIAWVKHWDPYPFILLNLALSFQAAYTGPIVMMSQNRQSEMADRRNRLDLQINLLSEQENTQMLSMLRMLCEKHGLDVASTSNVEVLEQETEPEVLFGQLANASDEADKAQSDLDDTAT